MYFHLHWELMITMLLQSLFVIVWTSSCTKKVSIFHCSAETTISHDLCILSRIIFAYKQQLMPFNHNASFSNTQLQPLHPYKWLVVVISKYSPKPCSPVEIRYGAVLSICVRIEVIAAVKGSACSSEREARVWEHKQHKRDSKKENKC